MMSNVVYGYRIQHLLSIVVLSLVLFPLQAMEGGSADAPAPRSIFESKISDAGFPSLKILAAAATARHFRPLLKYSEEADKGDECPVLEETFAPELCCPEDLKPLVRAFWYEAYEATSRDLEACKFYDVHGNLRKGLVPEGKSFLWGAFKERELQDVISYMKYCMKKEDLQRDLDRALVKVTHVPDLIDLYPDYKSFNMFLILNGAKKSRIVPAQPEIIFAVPGIRYSPPEKQSEFERAMAIAEKDAMERYNARQRDEAAKRRERRERRELEEIFGNHENSNDHSENHECDTPVSRVSVESPREIRVLVAEPKKSCCCVVQ